MKILKRWRRFGDACSVQANSGAQTERAGLANGVKTIQEYHRQESILLAGGPIVTLR